MALIEEVSVVLLRKLPPKLKDHSFERALLDLGAGVNLMPYNVYEMLGLGELQPTSTTLKVGKYILHANFIVLDMEESPMPSPLPIILGRPFMRTADDKICVKKGTMSTKVNGEKNALMSV